MLWLEAMAESARSCTLYSRRSAYNATVHKCCSAAYQVYAIFSLENIIIYLELNYTIYLIWLSTFLIILIQETVEKMKGSTKEA